MSLSIRGGGKLAFQVFSFLAYSKTEESKYKYTSSHGPLDQNFWSSEFSSILPLISSSSIVALERVKTVIICLIK